MLDYIKIKNFSLSKGNIKKVKKITQATGWQEMFGTHPANGSYPESYQELLQINKKLTT